MNFLTVLWLVYVIASVFISFTSQKIRKDLPKKPPQKRDDLVRPVSVEKKIEVSSPKRNAMIKQNNDRAEELRRRHGDEKGFFDSLRDVTFTQVVDSLKEFSGDIETLSAPKNQVRQEKTAALENQLDSVHSLELEDDYIESSQEYYEDEMRSVEEHLSELDDWYSDNSLEDDSWMDLDDQVILEEDNTHQVSRQSNVMAKQLNKAMKNPQSLRQLIVFNEIIQKPKSLR